MLNNTKVETVPIYKTQDLDIAIDTLNFEFEKHIVSLIMKHLENKENNIIFINTFPGYLFLLKDDAGDFLEMAYCIEAENLSRYIVTIIDKPYEEIYNIFINGDKEDPNI